MNTQNLNYRSLIHQISKILHKISRILIRDFHEMSNASSEITANKFAKDIDQKIEEIILKELHYIAPDIPILFEGDKKIEAENKAMLFIIDPLDGTSNFKNNLKDFGISIALQENEITVLGLVMFPISGELFVAQKNKGCHMINENQEQIRMRAHQKISKNNLFLFTRTSMFLKPKNCQILHHFAKQKLHIRCSGCVSMDLARLACGRAHLLIFDTTKIWDIAAGELMVLEAGGFIRKHNDYFIASSSERLIEEILKFIA